MKDFGKGIDRRSVLALGIGAGLAPALSACAAPNVTDNEPDLGDLDTTSPQGNLDTYVKIIGSTGEETVYTSFKGIFWGIVPNRAPVQLCGFHGLGRFDWQPQDDGSYLRRSFDVGMFSDLKSGEALTEMYNPLTEQTVQPHHFKYGGGIELQTTTGVRAPNKPADKNAPPRDFNWELQGQQLLLNQARSGTFPHPIPIADWPQESSGEEYYFGSEYTYISPLAQLRDPAVKSADYTLFWSSVTSWDPWMLMADAPGFVLWRGYGQKLARPQDAPKGLLAHIAKVQPNYFDRNPPWQGTQNSFESFMATRTPSPKA